MWMRATRVGYAVVQKVSVCSSKILNADYGLSQMGSGFQVVQIASPALIQQEFSSLLQQGLKTQEVWSIEIIHPEC